MISRIICIPARLTGQCQCQKGPRPVWDTFSLPEMTNILRPNKTVNIIKRHLRNEQKSSNNNQIKKKQMNAVRVGLKVEMVEKKEQ